MKTIFRQFRFLDWQVYKDSKVLFLEVKGVVERMPKTYRFDIGSQMVRSALSVVLNIAEGSGKSKKELSRFLDIALGSLYETRAALDVVEGSFGDPENSLESIVKSMSSIASQIGGLKKSLKT